MKKFLKRLLPKIEEYEYEYVASSRRVIKSVGDELYDDGGGYYKSNVWVDIKDLFKEKLHKGESIYVECVGFTKEGQEIQKGYDYGCVPGEYKIYVYRITMTNVDGHIFELPWHQMKGRAKELGVEVTPEIFYGKVGELVGFDSNDPGQDLVDYLTENYVRDQSSQFCKNDVPEEGVVVRVERGDGIEAFKLKNFAFLTRETKQLDQGEVDMETQEDGY